MAPVGHFFAQTVQPVHLSTSILKILSSVQTPGTHFLSKICVFVLFAEPFQGAENRVWSRLSQAAKRGFLNDFAQFFQLHNPFETFKRIFLAVSVWLVGNAFQYFEHSSCSFAAGNTFSAAFALNEIHKEFGHIHHTGVFVHHHQSAAEPIMAPTFSRDS